MPIPGPLEVLLILAACAVPVAAIGLVIFFALNYRNRMDQLEEKVDSLLRKQDASQNG